MNLGRNTFFIGFFAMCLPVISWAGEVPVINITDKTNPEIAELYRQYQDIQGKIDKIQSERVDKLGDNYRALKENEQSLENRTLTATTTAATGAGGMELAQGLAEQKADKTAEQSMTNYIATMRCKYGDTQVRAGLEEIELPGGNDSEMAKLRNEYFALAADLKERKAALGMKPGIESEEILDKSEMGLYDDENIGISDGAYASLYRAQMYNSEKDKQEIDAAKESAENRVVGGATAAGAGVVAGVVGNATINKNAPKNESDAINREYDKKLADATAEQKDIAAQLESAIAKNANAVKQYNEELQQHQALIETIKKSPENCRAGFDDYIETISKLSPIENETDDVPNNLPDFDEQQEKLNECTTYDSTDSGDTSEDTETYEYNVEGDGDVVDFESKQQFETGDNTCCPCSSESGQLSLSRAAKLSRAAAQVVQKSNDKCCACPAPQKTSNTAKSGNNKITYKEACGADYNKKDPSIICKDNIFTNKTVGGTQVDVSTAKGLAKEWARVNGYRAIECSDEKPRPIPVMKSQDYGIKCASKEADKQGKRAYFEFIFDDLEESFSETVRINTSRAICEKIYKQSGGRAPNQVFHCYADKAVCDKINTTMNNMYPGSTAKITVVSGQNRCVMSWTTSQNRSSVRNDFRGQLDSFVFCKGAQTQLRNDQTLENMLRQYIANKLKINISSVKCSDGSRPYYGSECGNKGTSEDVKSCSVGDKVIEFVLDDIHETSKKKQQGAKQSMSCVVSDGTFNGQECKFANKKQCDVFIESTTKICPECKKPKWNPNTNLCELPDAATVTKMEKRERRAMIVGGVVVSVVVTVGTAGAGSATVVGVVLSSVEVAGGAMEYFAQRKIDGMAHDFFIKSAKCNNASCAKGMIANNMQEMANIANDLETYEIEALDYEFARLLKLIDPESDFYKKIVANGATIEDNKKGFFDPDGWNQAQVWRAIGIGLQLASVGEALITKIAGTSRFASKFPKMQETLLSKVKITRKSATIAKPTKVVDEVADASKVTSDLTYSGKMKGFKINSVIPVKNYEGAAVSVFKFIDETSGKTYYLKHTDEMLEITRTKQAYAILNGKSDIVHTVEVIEDDQRVLNDFAVKHNLTNAPGDYWFVMNEMPGSLTSQNLIYDAEQSLRNVLLGKPITLAEQEEILNSIQRLHDNGIVHGDLYSNMFFTREANGKLRVDIIDYEPWSAEMSSASEEMDSIRQMMKDLQKNKLAQTADNVSKSTVSRRTSGKISTGTRRANNVGKVTPTATKTDNIIDSVNSIKIANADSPESEAGFAAMMNRVDESNARNITPEDIEADFVRRQAAEGGKYTEADIAERVQHYNDYRDERVLLDANGQPVVNKKGETQYMDTQRMYTQDGVYTEERQKIHEAILDDLFKDADKAQPAAGEKPTFVMLGGRGGSGKSSLDGIAYDRSRSIVIDADDIKTKLPEYKNLVDSHSEYAGLNAWEVHEESSDIVKEALDMARERGINVVLDGTMSSSKSALSKITPFEDAGYRIEGAYMYLPREESTVRAMGRGMGEGRFVPTDVLLNMKDNEKAFGEVSGHFDSWSIWTTEGLQKGEVPNMIGHSEGLSVFEKPVNPDLSAPLTGIIKE